MNRQSVQRTCPIPRLQAAHRFAILVLVGGLLLSASPLLAEGPPRSCDLTGTWYGGSIVAYHMTVVPAAKPGHFTVIAQGMYKDSVMNTVYTGQVAKKHDRYEGPLMQLSTSDDAFLGPPPLIGKMPDIIAGWTSMKLVDCNTIESRIPFFGLYAGSGIWEPGIVWKTDGKVPLVAAPDLDLLDFLNEGKPIKETYHRLLNTVNRDLLHKEPEAH
jgi:hypothetical protein